MEGLWTLDVISRIVHVGTAIVLVGGTAFMRFVLFPAAGEIEQQEHEKLRGAVVGRWRRFVHTGIALFLASGLYNYVRALSDHEDDALYHALVGTKILLALAVFFLAAALVGRSAKLEGVRRQRGRWLAVLLTLAAVIVAISGFVKVRGPAPQPVDAEPTATRPG